MTKTHSRSLLASHTLGSRVRVKLALLILMVLSIAGSGVLQAHAQSNLVSLAQTTVHQDRDPPRRGSYAVSSTLEDASQQLNINTATATELEELLPGIGPAKALNIIQWRTANGPFQTLEQLLEVSGIGPRTLEKIRGFLRVGDSLATSSAVSSIHQNEQAVVLAVQRIVARAQRDAEAVQSMQSSPQ